MIIKSIKYLLIAFINALLLTTLLEVSIDKLEYLSNAGVEIIGFLQIALFSIISLIGMRILIA